MPANHSSLPAGCLCKYDCQLLAGNTLSFFFINALLHYQDFVTEVFTK